MGPAFVSSLVLGLAWAHPGVDEQLAPLDQAIADHPDDAALWLRRCDLHRTFGHLEDALADCDQAATHGAHPPDLALSRGLLFVAAATPERAIPELRTFLEVHPDHPAAWRGLAAAFELSGAWSDAAANDVKS